MAVLIRILNPGMTPEVYDAIARGAAASLKAAAGFQFHVAFPSEEGVVVVEVWDDPDQHMQWFDDNVKPHLPPGTELSHEVTKLHNVLKP